VGRTGAWIRRKIPSLHQGNLIRTFVLDDIVLETALREKREEPGSVAHVSITEPKISVYGEMLKEDRILGEEAPDSLNNTYAQHRVAFHRWL
jgi:hypothetical protein